MCTQPLGPYRSGEFTTQEANGSLKTYIAIPIILLLALCICGLIVHIDRTADVRHLRDNATVEATAAARRLFGAAPNAVYCRPEVGSMVCERRYPHGANLCDVFVPNVGSVQLCCDTHDYRNNIGCSVRVVTLGDLQWQATQ